MKKILKQFSIILPAILLIQLNLFAQDDNEKETKKYEFVKSKSINKSYNISANDKLSIENSFGKVAIHTWEKNEIKVDVSIEVSSNKENVAEKMLEGITVADEQSGKDIKFKTNIHSNYNGNNKTTMKVNYDIFMPSANPLNISNEFGATIIPDFRGEVDLESKFGSLIAGNLANVKKILVEFGKAKLENITNGNIIIKYSKASFGKLMGTIKMNIEFSSAIQMSLDNTLSGLDIKSSYSTINLKPDNDLAASYTISTSYGKLKNNTSLKFAGGDEERENRRPKFDFIYTGKSGNGTVPVKVTTSYGNVILGEPGPNDIKEKAKTKA